MDVKYVNPFLESFESVMPQLGFTDIQKVGLSVKGQDLLLTGVVIVVGVVGAIKGNVVYSLEMQTAKNIASIMMGSEVDELDEISQSALSELSNMLTASAATLFYNMGIVIDISTPTLLYGHNIAVKMSSKKVLCIQLKADDNDVEISVAFEE